jgi:sphinganine-1-phosphate aldolase
MTDSGATIPQKGLDKQALLEQMKTLQEGDVRWREHRAFGLVYHHSAAHTDLLKAAYTLYFSENGLNPMAFKSLQRMERDVVRMTANLFRGDSDAVGSMTSGGTESLLLAVLTYRNHARRKYPWIRKPEIIIPESAHVAFRKAGEYFGVKIVKTPLQPDFRADVSAVEQHINRNTIAIVGSAPSYPHGVVDPIEELAGLAARHNIPMHVDACLGGFFLPWVEKLGYPVPLFDFRVPGVTSMSADVHKYGYASKGASTILYRHLDYFRDQIFAEVDWSGGAYGGATMAGTRPGGAIAAAWASLNALGEQGFMDNARAVMETTALFREGIRAIPELTILGDPAMSVLAYGARDNKISIYAVADQLDKRGWHVDRIQRPEGIHIIVNPGHAAIVDAYLQDLRDAVAHVKAHPEAALDGTAPMYGLIAKMPLRSMVKRNVVSIFAGLYTQKDQAAMEDAGEEETPGVPKPILLFMRIKAGLNRVFRRNTDR